MSSVEKQDVPQGDAHHTIIRTKPLLNMKQILLMNLGFFGIQYSFGMQQSAVNTIYRLLGANVHELPLLNMAGPITGLLIQPLIGALSDRTWSDRYGRRRPYFLIGAIGCSICLALFPFASAIWMAAVLLWLLDASNNTAMEPYRAFISDKLPPSQLAKGFLTQSFFTGFGITLANLCIALFPSVLPGQSGALPNWVYGAFFLGSVCSIGTVLVTVLSTPEIPPTPEERAELKAKKGGFGVYIKEIWDAIVDMPTELRKLALVYLFQWYAMNIYWQMVTSALALTIWDTEDSKSAGFEAASSWTGTVNGWYNIVTFSTAFLLVAFAKKHGAKRVHSFCLLLAAVAFLTFPHIDNKWLVLVPITGLGIAWASIMGVPYIMAVRMIPSTRYGVYMGIINMMIVIPMLFQTLTFGWILTHFLGDNPVNAIMFAGVLMILGAIAMLWIKEPPIVRDVDDLNAMPAPGGH